MLLHIVSTHKLTPIIGICVCLCAPRLSGAQRIDPPAADTSPAALFLRAAHPREVPPGLASQCDSVMRRAADFLMRDTGIQNNAIRDEQGRKVPPYIYHAVIDGDDHFGYRASFPSFHHAYLVEAFLNYYNYSGNKEALRRAREVADWTIAHSTPAGWKWPYLPWSTYTEGKPGGYEDKDNLQPDKVGYMGLAYTRLFEVTGSKTYLDAAVHAADTITTMQNGDGSWPFRVNPQTGLVYQNYTAALFMNVAFLEKMFTVTHNLDYKNAQITAWIWLLRNPLRTNNWSGLYEDIPKGSDSQVHYSPLQSIRLLLRYRTSVNAQSYLGHASRLYDYTMDGLSFSDREMGFIMREQTGYLAATPSSTMNWTMMSAEFFLTTLEQRYRQTVLEGLRMVTRYGLKPDGRSHNTVLGPNSYGDWGSWYSLTSPIVRYIYQDMGCLPECAPEGQTHLLRTSTQVREIEYLGSKLRYSTLPNSIDLIKLEAEPVTVTCEGKTLPTTTQLSAKDCTLYNPKSHVLLVRHSGSHVTVLMRATKRVAP